MYSICGKLKRLSLTQILVQVGADNSNVTYSVTIPAIFSDAGTSGEYGTILLHEYARENEPIKLFGFCSEEQRDMFRSLIAIDGVGVTMALSILSAHGADEILAGVLDGDESKLRAPGVGPKTVKKIMMALSDSRVIAPKTAPAPAVVPIPKEVRDARDEAVLALVSLGLRKPEAEQRVKRVCETLVDETSSSVILREALKKE